MEDVGERPDAAVPKYVGAEHCPTSEKSLSQRRSARPSQEPTGEHAAEATILTNQIEEALGEGFEEIRVTAAVQPVVAGSDLEIGLEPPNAGDRGVVLPADVWPGMDQLADESFPLLGGADELEPGSIIWKKSCRSTLSFSHGGFASTTSNPGRGRAKTSGYSSGQ